MGEPDESERMLSDSAPFPGVQLMATRLVHLVVDANDPAALARFWADALGWVIGDVADDEVDVWPEGYSYPDPVALPLVFVPVPEAKRGKDRVHLDLASSSAADQAALVARLRDLGATPADIGQHRPGRPELPWTVLADPEGNEFCVLEPRMSLHGHRPGGGGPDRLRQPGRAWPGSGPGRPGWPVVRADSDITGLRSADGSRARTWSSSASPRPQDGEEPLAPRRRARTWATRSPAEVTRLRGPGATPADIGSGPRRALDRAGRPRRQRVLRPQPALSAGRDPVRSAGGGCGPARPGRRR